MVHVRRTQTTNFFVVRKPGEGFVTNSMTRSRSAVSASPSLSRPSREAVSISLDDICKMAERKRQTWSARSRRQAVTKAHADIHQTGFRDNSRSRPNTSASRYINAVRRETMTPKSIRSEPLPSRVSSRQDRDFPEDSENQYPINTVSSPSPVSCEIIGPQVCRECHRNFRRIADKSKSESLFRSLRISNGNLTTATILKKYLPNLSYEQIQDKVARGEIAKNFLPKNPASEKADDEVEDDYRNKQIVLMDTQNQRHHSRNERWKTLSELYFVNIQDLNTKITSGKVSKEKGFSYSDKKKGFVQRSVPLTDDSMFPTFVSPKRVTLVKEPTYHTYFDPPLLPRTKQLPEPSFFAGSDTDYKLPERLPDEIVFQETVKSSPRKSSQASMSDVEELEYEKEQPVT